MRLNNLNDPNRPQCVKAAEMKEFVLHRLITRRINDEMENVLKERVCIIIGTITPLSRRSKRIYNGVQIEKRKEYSPHPLSLYIYIYIYMLCQPVQFVLFVSSVIMRFFFSV